MKYIAFCGEINNNEQNTLYRNVHHLYGFGDKLEIGMTCSMNGKNNISWGELNC
jgi:hypothetical protein